MYFFNDVITAKPPDSLTEPVCCYDLFRKNCLHKANLKVSFPRAKVAVTTYALSDASAFFKATASSILTL